MRRFAGAPDVLVFQVMIYGSEGIEQQKIMQAIDYPMRLDLRPYMAKAGEPVLYR